MMDHCLVGDVAGGVVLRTGRVMMMREVTKVGWVVRLASDGEE